MKDQKMQLMATHAIEDVEMAKHEEAFSRAQKEHRKTEGQTCLQELYNSTLHEHTSFNFINIHLMLHCEESVQRIRPLVKDSTKTQEIKHPKM
jgi:transcriptional regulator of NAD metabolism